MIGCLDRLASGQLLCCQVSQGSSLQTVRDAMEKVSTIDRSWFRGRCWLHSGHYIKSWRFHRVLNISRRKGRQLNSLAYDSRSLRPSAGHPALIVFAISGVRSIAVRAEPGYCGRSLIPEQWMPLFPYLSLCIPTHSTPTSIAITAPWCGGCVHVIPLYLASYYY